MRPLILPAFAQPLFVWLLFALPTAFLLLFLNRRIRAIGPVLLALMIVASTGAHVTTAFLATDLGLRIFGTIAGATGIGAEAVFYGVPLVGLLVFLIPGWFVVRWIASRYQAKRLSDQRFVFDAIWLFATLLLCQRLIFDVGMIGWTGLIAFAAYLLISRIGLANVARQASRQPPVPLLLLRVFGFQRRTERLFGILGARWRYAGSIQLIAATDLASATIDPGEFLNFVSGRLRHTFIHNGADLDRRLAEVDQRPDPDGRFRVNEFFCTDDTWRAAAVRLMEASRFVVMDLRGFSPDNKGCIFELQALLDALPLPLLALLIDDNSNLAFLEQTLADCWKRLASPSPNAGSPAPRIRLLRCEGSGADAVSALFVLADQAMLKDQRGR
ncbi:MAG: hypothetical protein HC826_02020 [Rhodospirillales bacterium]|nr:hypothetical protein [Rhodospirillales bacterium]